MQRPYEIHSATPIDEILDMFRAERVRYSSTWCKGMVALLKKVRVAHVLGVGEASGKAQGSWHQLGQASESEAPGLRSQTMQWC